MAFQTPIPEPGLGMPKRLQTLSSQLPPGCSGNGQEEVRWAQRCRHRGDSLPSWALHMSAREHVQSLRSCPEI